MLSWFAITYNAGRGAGRWSHVLAGRGVARLGAIVGVGGDYLTRRRTLGTRLCRVRLIPNASSSRTPLSQPHVGS